ncbi:hypothetical protein V2G26_002645 [Clonostachys chloroleuca]
MHKRVLLTSATGYVGGSVLTSLLASPRLEPISISVLARDLKRLAALEGKVSLVTFRDLDDTDSLESIASKFDIIYPLRQWSPRGLSTSVHPWAGPKKKVTGWRTISHPHFRNIKSGRLWDHQTIRRNSSILRQTRRHL